MILSMSGQARLFLFTALLGFAAGFVYDLFRILRKTFKHPDFLTHLEDFAYWILITTLIFYFMLNKNLGEVRLFSIIGIFLGMIIYFYTLSLVVFNVSVAVIGFIKKLIDKTVKIILFPIKLLVRIVLFPLKIIGGFLSPRIISAKKRTKRGLKKTGRYAKMKAAGLVKDFNIILRKH